MADKFKEQVSALVDDECAAQEIKLALRQLVRTEELQASWQRYHLISDVLKGNTPPVIDHTFTQRLRTAIDADAAARIIPAGPSLLGRWYKPLAGFALAASVAAVAVLVTGGDQPSGNVPSVAMPGGVNSGTLTTGVDQPDAKLDKYLVNHNSLASMSSVYGVLPYVRMASGSSGR